MYFAQPFYCFLNQINFLLLFLYDNIECLILLLLILPIFVLLALGKDFKLKGA